MNSKDYDMMIRRIDGTIKQASDINGVISKIDNLEDLPIKHVRTLVQSARSVMGTQDKIFTAELYHILNMGNMSAVQTTKFLKKIKELGSYRSVLKYVSAYQVECLPKLQNKPTDPTYKCGALGVNVTDTLSIK